MNQPERLLTVKDLVAQNVISSVKTAYSWRWLTDKTGRLHGPKFVRAGRRVLYRPRDVEEWLESGAAPDATED